MIADRVRETTSTTGTGAFELDGPPSGRRGFVAAIGNGNPCRYVAENSAGTEWELGRGTVTEGNPDTLSRTTIFNGSAGPGVLVNFSPGQKRVFIMPDADSLRFGVGELPTAAGSPDVRTVAYKPKCTALLAGLEFRFINASGDSTSTTPTVQIDDNVAKTVVRKSGDACRPGDLQAGALIELVYDGTNLRLQNEPAHEVGEVADFAGATAPSRWLLCAGQAVSRTTYAALFAVLSTTHGAGDGSTTFNLPDYRGRGGVGKDDMGGSAASRVTTGGSGINGAALGAAGGHQLMQSHGHGVNDPTHNHGVNDPTHGHPIPGTVGPSGAGGGVQVAGATPSGNNTLSAATGISLNASGTGISIQNAGSGGSQNMPPSIVVNKMIYAGA